MNHITKNSLKLFNYAVEESLAGTQRELCEKIGLQETAVRDIRNGRRAFTHDQLYELVKLTKANVNWVYGFSKEMFLQEKPTSPIARIRQALAEIEEEKGKRKKKTG